MTRTALARVLPTALTLWAFAGCGGEPANAKDPGGHGHHGGEITDPRAEAEPVVDIALEPAAGAKIGLVFESYLSPQQEGDEESETPDLAPEVFKSTKASTLREDRLGRGHGILAFTRDFSRAYVQMAVTGIEPGEIVMAHIHCGKPGVLGPIIVDFGKTGDVADYFADGKLTYEIVNKDLERVVDEGEGLVGAFAHGCPIEKGIPIAKIRTIGGMATVAREGELYFNIHTAGHTFFGDIRGQLLPLER